MSFGAPVLEGWGRPGRMLAVRGRLRVVQVDAWRSPSAALADEWVPIAPGGEGPLALALATWSLREGGRGVDEDARRRSRPSRPGSCVAHRCRPRADRGARANARARAPAVALGGGDPGGGPLPADAERAIALLNVVLGSVGREGGFVPRRDLPGGGAAPRPPDPLADVPAGSVGVLLLDGADDGRALPWPVVARDARARTPSS